MKVKEISVNEFRARFSNQAVLQEAFSTIKNATLVKSSDATAVVLDEETGIFYDVDYEIDVEGRRLVLKNFSPFVLKEETLDLKESYARAMDTEDDKEAVGIVKNIVRHLVKSHVGGEKKRLVAEAKSKSLGKRIDKARRAVLEDINLFKAENRRLLSEVKSAGFYDRFVEKLNAKYLQDGVKIVVADKLNFNLIDRRNKSDKIQESVYVKHLDKTAQKLDAYFNPTDVVRNSPTFIQKLNGLMEDIRVLRIAGKDENLEESSKAFATLASKWPVLYTMSGDRHSDFAIRHFSTTIADKSKAKEYVETYKALVESNGFKKDQKDYLEKNYKWSYENLVENEGRKLSESFYNARLLDDVQRAVSTIREKVDKIDSINVKNYLKFAEDRINSMLRSGRFDEELFEQLTTDIFGDSNLVTFSDKEDVFSDAEYRPQDGGKVLGEAEIKTFEVEARAHKLVVEMRELMPQVDKTLRFALEEEFDLLKSMIAINVIEEKKLEAIEKLTAEIKKSTKPKKDEALSEVKKQEAWCVVCSEEVTAAVNEALASGKQSIACPSCGTELELGE